MTDVEKLAGEKWPNLYALAHGCVSGRFSEWPALRDEAAKALTALTAGGAERPCTCHPDDNPPKPCPKRYALTECRAASAERDAVVEECAKVCDRLYREWYGGSARNVYRWGMYDGAAKCAKAIRSLKTERTTDG